MMYRMSKHATQERIDRIFYIVTEVGLGEELSIVRRFDGAREVLTTTGVVLILSDEDILITAFVASMDKAYALWKNGRNETTVPRWFYERVKRNRVHWEATKGEDDSYKFFQKRY